LCRTTTRALESKKIFEGNGKGANIDATIEKQILQDEEKMLQEGSTSSQEEGEGPQGIQEPTPRPGIGYYYKFIQKEVELTSGCKLQNPRRGGGTASFYDEHNV